LPRIEEHHLTSPVADAFFTQADGLQEVEIHTLQVVDVEPHLGIDDPPILQNLHSGIEVVAGKSKVGTSPGSSHIVF
jgi:hypothetical protein